MKIYKTLNWPLLRDQKQTLLMLRDNVHVTPADAEHLDGIINLIDALQDEAVDSGSVSETEVFGGRRAP